MHFVMQAFACAMYVVQATPDEDTEGAEGTCILVVELHAVVLGWMVVGEGSVPLVLHVWCQGMGVQEMHGQLCVLGFEADMAQVD